MADSTIDSDTLAAAKKAAGTAAAAALAGGLAGAAKAFRDRHARAESERNDEPDEDEATEPPVETRAEQEEPEPEPEAEETDEEREEPRRPASGVDVASLVRRAREHAADLLGVQPESISSFEQRDGSFAVSVEVVEVRRVPDSTDVLASYELTLDEDGDLVGFERRRRYRRAQVDDES